MSLQKIFLLNILIVVLTINYGFSNTGSNIVTPDSQYVGIWQGMLHIGETRLRIVFHISKETDSLKASLDSPDQGAFGIPVSSISTSGDSIRLNVQAVPAKEDLSAISEALKKGGNKHYKVEELEGLNHLFQKAKTGTLSEYSQIEETISPKALDLVGDWILDITK